MAALHSTWDFSSSSPTQGWNLHPPHIRRGVSASGLPGRVEGSPAVPAVHCLHYHWVLGSFLCLVHTRTCKHTQTDRCTYRHHLAPPTSRTQVSSGKVLVRIRILVTVWQKVTWTQLEMHSWRSLVPLPGLGLRLWSRPCCSILLCPPPPPLSALLLSGKKRPPFSHRQIFLK